MLNITKLTLTLLLFILIVPGSIAQEEEEQTTEQSPEPIEVEEIDDLVPTITSIGTIADEKSVTLSVGTDEPSTCKFSTTDENYDSMDFMTTTGEISHSVKQSFTQSSSGNYYIRCKDGIGNTMTSSATTTFNIVIEEGQETEISSPSAPVSSPQKASSSQTSSSQQSSSSNRNVGKGGSKKNTAATTFLVASVSKGEVREFGLNKKALAVDKIGFTAKKNYENKMSVSIKRTYEFANKEIYKIPDAHSFFEINAQNINDMNFRDFKITFTIENTWLTINKIKEDEVSLYRHSEGQWGEYKATKIQSKEKLKTTYEATVPGFSYFAIAKSGIKTPKAPAKKEDSVKEETEVVLDSLEGDEVFKEETLIADEENIIEEVQATVKSNRSLWIVIFVLISLILFKVFVFKTKKS